MTIESLYALIRNLLSGIPAAGEQERSALQRRIFEGISGLGFQDVVMNPGRESGASEDYVRALMDRVASGEPLEYIFNSARFLDMDFATNGCVLIPRPETEELALMAAGYLKSRTQMCRVLDIGTGSGCIPISLASMVPCHEYFAVDISGKALDTARQNAAAHGCRVIFSKMDILNWEKCPLDDDSEAIVSPMKKFDLIISNPPYVMESEKPLMKPNVLDYEPHIALFVSDYDPLLFYRAIAGFAAEYLNGGGRLYFEINERLGKETAALLESRGFCNVIVSKDLFGKDRFVSGVWPSI